MDELPALFKQATRRIIAAKSMPLVEGPAQPHDGWPSGTFSLPTHFERKSVNFPSQGLNAWRDWKLKPVPFPFVHTV
jgi:hypothetical protein